MEILSEDYAIIQMSLKWEVFFFYSQEVVLRADIKVKVIGKS